MRRILPVIATSLVLTLAPAAPVLALSCASGYVVWIEAYNSADGTYKQVSWEGGSQYFSGSGTDYINTRRQTNAYVSVSSDSSTKWVSEFCVPAGVEFR